MLAQLKAVSFPFSVSPRRLTATCLHLPGVLAGPLPLTMAQSILDTMPGATTGTVLISDPLNFWGGKRVKPMQDKNTEPVFEPATGKCCGLVRFVTRSLDNYICDVYVKAWQVHYEDTEPLRTYSSSMVE